jgi:hypothetical protein
VVDVFEKLTVDLRIDRADPSIGIDLKDGDSRSWLTRSQDKRKQRGGRDSHLPFLSVSMTALKAGLGWR